MTDSTHSYSLLFGSAPILVAATCPSLNKIIVGMPRTPYLRGVCGFSSILTLATVTRPAISVASSSRNGAIILQGPHHSAQKSTSTGPLAPRTSLSNVPSLTAVGFMRNPLAPIGDDIRGAEIPTSRQVPCEPLRADRHQARCFRPQDRTGDLATGINPRQRCAIAGELADVYLRDFVLALRRRAHGLVIDNQHALPGDDQPVD